MPLYLSTPVIALVEGIYEEKVPLAEIRKHGDFGLGTFDHLDGELVLLDGKAYQVRGDGRVVVVGDEARTPFSCVTFYRPFSQDTLEGETSYPGLLDWIHSLLPSPNLIYALRLDGHFASVTTRSVPKQECYRPLVEVAAEQPVFRFSETEGTLAGFYTPSFMASLNVPGLHLHFLSADRRQGGHLLECRPRRIRAGVQLIKTLEVNLPASLDYLTTDFQRDVRRDLDKAER